MKLKIYKDLLKLIHMRTNHPKLGKKKLNKTLHRRRYVCEKMLLILCHQENTNEKARGYHYVPIRMAQIQNTDNTKYRRGCGTTGTIGGDATRHSHIGDSLAICF